jgi:hypothetical protein
MRRKLIAFDEETWRALDLLARDSMTTWQELADALTAKLRLQDGPRRCGAPHLFC